MSKRTRRWLCGVGAVVISGFLLVRWFNGSGESEEEFQRSDPSRWNLSESSKFEHGDASEVGIDEVLTIAARMLDRLNNEVEDYRGVLVKRERIKGQLGPAISIEFKIRNGHGNSGFAAYLRFKEPKSVAGCEVIWGPDLNDGHIVVHEIGIKRMLGTLSLDPHGMLAMRGQKYPITEIGLIRLVEKLIEKGRSESAIGQATVSVIEDVQVGECSCTLYEVVNPENNGKSEFHIARVYVDSDRMLPLKYAAYMWPSEVGGEPELEEEYTYLDVETNVGLTDADFDPNNSQYDFP